MILISAGLVLAAVVLLIAGFVLAQPFLIMWSIVVSVLSALFLVIGAFLRRHELFPGVQAATPGAPLEQHGGQVPAAMPQAPQQGLSPFQAGAPPAPFDQAAPWPPGHQQATLPSHGLPSQAPQPQGLQAAGLQTAGLQSPDLQAAGAHGSGPHGAGLQPGAYPQAQVRPAYASGQVAQPRPPALSGPQAGISPDALVLVLPGRKRYHVAGCRQLAGREHQELIIEEALEEGFTPCTTCLPDSALGGHQLPPADDADSAALPSYPEAAKPASTPSGAAQATPAAPASAFSESAWPAPALPEAGRPESLFSPGRPAAGADTTRSEIPAPPLRPGSAVTSARLPAELSEPDMDDTDPKLAEKLRPGFADGPWPPKPLLPTQSLPTPSLPTRPVPGSRPSPTDQEARGPQPPAAMSPEPTGGWFARTESPSVEPHDPGETVPGPTRPKDDESATASSWSAFTATPQPKSDPKPESAPAAKPEPIGEPEPVAKPEPVGRSHPVEEPEDASVAEAAPSEKNPEADAADQSAEEAKPSDEAEATLDEETPEAGKPLKDEAGPTDVDLVEEPPPANEAKKDEPAKSTGTDERK